METAHVLSGHSVLVVEDEPLIAFAIMDCFSRAGATVLPAPSLRQGLGFVDEPALSAAILDFGLRNVDGTALCARLRDRRIPFILHSGFPAAHKPAPDAIVVPKPAPPEHLVRVVVGMLRA